MNCESNFEYLNIDSRFKLKINLFTSKSLKYKPEGYD